MSVIRILHVSVIYCINDTIILSIYCLDFVKTRLWVSVGTANLGVLGQVVWPGKALVARQTPVRLDPGMRALVPSQFVRPGELPAAAGPAAHKRLFSVVASHVRLQLRSLAVHLGRIERLEQRLAKTSRQLYKIAPIALCPWNLPWRIRFGGRGRSFPPLCVSSPLFDSLDLGSWHSSFHSLQISTRSVIGVYICNTYFPYRGKLYYINVQVVCKFQKSITEDLTYILI